MADDATNDDLFNDDADASSDSGSGDTGNGDDAPPQDKKATGESGNSDKRVADLMSKWQTEQAEHAKTRAALELAQGKTASNDGGEPAPSADSNEFLELAREAGRQSLYQSEPRLAALGLEVTVIEGNSAKEMQASLAKMRDLLNKAEGSARTKVLKEHGLDPDIAGGGSDKPRDFTTMTDKEILELADRSRGRL